MMLYNVHDCVDCPFHIEDDGGCNLNMWLHNEFLCTPEQGIHKECPIVDSINIKSFQPKAKQ